MGRFFRAIEEKLFFGLCCSSTLLAAIALFAIIGTILLEALPSLSWYFILTPEAKTPGLGQGIANAIAGTILLSFFSTLIATPFAFGTALYLQRYAKESKLTRLIRFFIEVLSGTPSIILGAFGLLFFVYYMKYYTGGFSLISGSIALAVLILPVIERALEQAIESVPHDIEEGSYALGADKWQTIARVTIPYSLSGLITGMILGFGRAAEESAVVILTAGYTQHFPEIAIKARDSLFLGVKVYPFQDLVGSLPYAVYHAYENSNVISISNGFACAFILITFVLIINITAKSILWYSTRTSRNPSPLLSSLTRSLFGGNGRFSRLKPIPAAACAAAEIAEARRDASIPVIQKAVRPATITPSPISTTAELDWKKTLSSGLQVHPVQGEGGAGSPGGGMAASDVTPAGNNLYDSLLDPPDAPLPIDDALFEDDPVLLSDSPGADPGAALAALERAFMPEPVLMEEDPDPRIIEVPADEPWRRMTRNRLENTIAGITADPWEEP